MKELLLSKSVQRGLTARRWTTCRGVHSAVSGNAGSRPSAVEHERRKEREEGDISAVFASLSNEKATSLPERFGELKRAIIGSTANQQALIGGWQRLIGHLAKVTEEIERKQQDCIPQITYDQLVNKGGHGTSSQTQTLDAIKKSGSLIAKGVVDEETAHGWLDSIKQYIALNPDVKGFPKDDKQVFELYWSKAQLSARSHPRALSVQQSLLSLFSSSSFSSTTRSAGVSLTPISYADRLRIRHPGDAQFSLGPHADGGSVERWEDPTYRSVYQKILQGGRWEEYDAFSSMGERVEAKQNLYDGPGSCGVFRAFQGWTSLSNTGPGEGTLRVYPLVRELTAYMMLRPLFREKQSRSSLTREEYLAAENWQLDFDTTEFPGSPLARCQEFNDATHPHLELDRTMISMPRVRPGDQAWWHCDVIHAVESLHRGSGPSAVMYIPAVPLTLQNAEYLKDQRQVFLEGRPGPDFPGGVGESQFRGRGLIGDITAAEGRRAMGLESFEVTDELSQAEQGVRRKANEILGF